MKSKQQYYSRKAENLCPDCGQPSMAKSIYCYRHRERYRIKSLKQSAAQRARYIGDGRCVRCSAYLDSIEDKGKITCVNCRMHATQGRPYV